ncbi:alpha-2-macroglobulin family protein [Aestuariivita boseongensis]|uniref:alpha-2-macroglobulin family protein n=1 Tax=Aestuariivita boseongensis TaxID=1470562 RepID=UPI001FE13DB7|nr:alpha-2-macroglobulin family protein [Aestuariivita boseongensis]
MPDHRMIVTRDVDFYGSDLQAIFDTDLQICIRVCAQSPDCQAFTFNTRSNACFPKTDVTDETPYQGAISARKTPVSAELQANADRRRAALPFLSDNVVQDALREARQIGFRHADTGLALGDLLQAANAAEASGNLQSAIQWMGVAVAQTDRADLWTEYARLNLELLPDNGRARRNAERRALLGALNGYVRGETANIRANALMVMALVLERANRGRDMVSALRVAQSEASRPDVLAALDAAVAKYGFRVVDTQVDSDAEAPRICVEFSEPLVKAGVDYEPFVRLPSSDLVVTGSDRQLCVDGVTHGTRYQITLRSGLPAASGETLVRDIEITQYVRDRSPLVRFPGRSYVLPKAADAALPVETVNLSRIDLALRRVSDRNLLRAVQEGYFGRPLSKWEDESFAETIAQEVWTGTADVQNTLNQTMTTRLPLGEVLSDLPTGIYALKARNPDGDPYEDGGATQWFVLSDLGLATMLGTEGLHVDVRGLSDAQPRSGVEVTLISRANEVLGRATTDADGRARFDAGLTRGAGSAAPALVLAALGEGDVGFLSLTDPAFDLSDRGVEGRAPAGPVDVFLTPDRGAYRAGETIHLTALARDSDARAIDGLPLTAILTRPDGVEYRRLLSNGGRAGGHVFDFPLGLAVPRGTWNVALKTDANGPALATTQLLVEDFLPERIDFDLSLPDAPLRPGDTPPMTVEARYLFGAPGSDLAIEGSVALRATRSLEDWPGYKFGRYDDSTRTIRSYFDGGPTDGNGRAVVAVEIPQTDLAGMPLTATVTGRIAEGSGRPVERQITAVVRPAGSLIGIKPLFEDVVAEGTEARFDVIALSSDEQPEARSVTWTLNRVQTRYQWFQLYGSWDWEPITRRSRVATGTARIDGGPLRIAAPVEWGRYELIVETADGAYVAASQDFYAGWYAPADSSDTPDTLELSLDKPDYAPGDTAQLRIVPRFEGTALVTVMSDHVIARQAVEVRTGENLIPVAVTDDWGAGAYVTATVIRPMDVAAGQNPARALGLAYAKVAPGDLQLSVTLDAPDIVRPRGTLRVGATVDGAAPGDEVWMTVAAVDVGILNLTAFDSPDPSAHYFGQRRLGVELRDVYGRLIDGMNGATGRVRSGGDANAGMRMQSPPPTQELMARFSGPVQVGADGKAFVNFDLPAFNGTVRLMAVAWSNKGVGQAESDVIVRDPVVATVSLPRFLAPGDRSRMRIELVHAEGPAGEMALRLGVPQSLLLAETAAQVTLAEQGKETLDIALSSDQVGDHPITLTLVTPDGTELTQDFLLPVRANDPEIAETRRFALGAGETFTLDTQVFAEMRAGTGSALISAGALARFDAPGLLAALDRYPYGCTEQVTSQAMPLLYLSSVAQSAGLGERPDMDRKIASAISQVLARQTSSGAFGLWRAESGSDFWLDAYVADFLSRARAGGHAVPDLAFRMALDNLRNRVNFAADFDRGGQDIAYALMVLAREGAASMGDLRYYADQKADAFATPMALAQLASALAAYGDQVRADRLFALSQARLDAQTGDGLPVWRSDFGTYLRDAAGVLTLASEAGSTAIDTTALVDRVALRQGRRSTQEAAWSLLAAHALADNPASGLRVNGADVSGPFVRLLQDAMTDQSFAITTAQPTDITLTTIGVPLIPPPAGGTGYTISRSYYDLDGARMDPSALTLGERFVVVLEVRPSLDTGARLMIDDPLPAGVEIDNPSLLRSGDIRALDWLETSETEHTEFRSDRFLAAVDLRDRRTVTLAYVARAVTPGVYHQPAASVEDMYRPRYRARTDTGRVTIAE